MSIDLNESDLSKIAGVTVDVKLTNSDKVITGVIFTIVKQSNLLICKCNK